MIEQELGKSLEAVIKERDMAVANTQAAIDNTTQAMEHWQKAEARIRELEARQCEKCETSIEENSDLRFQVAERDRRIAELQAQLADMRDLAYNRAPKIAAEEANQQQEGLKAQLVEATMALATVSDYERWLSEAEADAARLRVVVEAAVDWADAFPGFEAGAFGSSAYLQAREGLLRAAVRDYRQAALSPRQPESENATD